MIDMDVATPGAFKGIRFPDGSVQTVAASGGGNALSFNSYAHFQNRTTTGVSNVAGGWAAIVLNTNVENSITGASRSGNQITLPAGTYYVDGTASAFSIGSGKNVLYNVTDASYPVVGVYMKPNGGSDDQGGGDAPFAGTFTISSSKVFELRMYATEAGYCPYVSVPYDVCADLKIWKLD